MHPSHQSGATERPSMVDRVTTRLVKNCPMSTLALLMLLAVGTAPRRYWPWPVVTTAVLIDVGLNLNRRRRAKRPRHFEANLYEPAG